MVNVKFKPVVLAVASVLAATSVYAADTIKADKVEVFSTTPLKGIGLPLNKVPANIQLADPKALKDQAGVSIADYMINNMQGVTVSDMTGNSWQPEINFRGYNASTLTGNPQGLSTYVDGVRVNEPFGDVTMWDKIPSFAIGDMQMVPGSNPLFGLNTLGGAISITTKTGRKNQGAAIEFEAGSWGRQRSLAEFGGVSKDGSVDYMVGYQHTNEDGWRKFSPSRLNQLFAKTGWQNDTSRLELTYMGSDNSLTGNGFLPENLLSGGRDQIHTRPDTTKNYSHFLALNGSHWFNDDTMFSGNVYYRKSNRHTVNGDLWEDADNIYNVSGGLNISAGVDGANEFSGSVLNKSKTNQDTYGATSQVTFNQDLMGKKNQFVIGLGYDYTRLHFKQSERVNVAAELDTDDAWVLGGSSGLLSGAAAFDSTRAPVMAGAGLQNERQTTGLTSKQYTARLFATDTLSLNDQWHLNAGASWNYTHVDNKDTFRGDNSPQTLTAKDRYTRLNPTFGLTHTPNENLTFYTSYSESSRAPTSIELGCSNPAFPCLLPSAMADDPPLKQVVAKTYEFGGRGLLSENVRWNAGVYHSMSHNDIQFMYAGAANGAGYYNNVGRTQRQGLDFGLAGSLDKFKWNASYSYVNATYDNEVNFFSSSNSSEDANKSITARPGDRIPSIPEHQLKLRAQYAVTPDWSIGSNLIGFSDSYVWGNENNQHVANTTRCVNDTTNCATGSGKVSGYFIVNLDTQYNIGGGWKAFAKATNIFDHEYNVGGRLAETMFNSAGVYGTESKVLSVLPGAPRAAWVGLRYEFAAPPKTE